MEIFSKIRQHMNEWMIIPIVVSIYLNFHNNNFYAVYLSLLMLLYWITYVFTFVMEKIFKRKK